MTIDELQQAVLNDLTTELQDTPNFNEDKLALKVSNAILEIEEIRRYPDSYSEEMIAADVERFRTTIYKLALYDYARIGAYGESTHSENGTNRGYIDRDKLLSLVVPLSRVL
jgi:hypothetical protein